ncbi:MAG: MFS transporter [Firmicutes bacterium]|nr:MFS transporter [Bacillota bacterium]MDD7601830.1 MFS transporter [Bacillota bacterium]MDY5855843.1 MFS transporter [Anaerovoracaceae bacterium]
MRGMKGLLNAEYGGIHAFYWMAYGALASFASVFLLGRGYSNTEIGMIFAAANVLAVILQPLLADAADHSGKLSLIGVSELVLGAIMLLTAGLLLLQKRTMTMSLVYVLILAGNATLQPLFNSLCFRLSESGIHINFGLCRSFGSLAYAVLCLFLGTLAEKKGILVLPVTGELVMGLNLASLLLITFHFHKACTENAEKAGREGIHSPEKSEQPEEARINLVQFARRNRLFFLLTLGVLGIYFGNGVLNNFMLQVISPLGGDSEDMGRIFSVMAFLEIPTMVLFEQINRHVSCKSLLKIASVAFVLKTVLIWQAGSVQTVLLAQGLQLFSFALFLPAMVHFIDQNMQRGEAVKGQALYTAMTTVASVICSLLGGLILDVYGAERLMMLATALTAIGAAVIFVMIGKIRPAQEERKKRLSA